MIPLRDRNPTHHPPMITVALIAVNIAVFLFIQPQEGVERIALPGGDTALIEATARFTFEYAAIPCELTEGRALDVEEVRATIVGTEVCRDQPGPELFDEKNVWLAALNSLFLHGSILHIGGNMLFLWIFGNNIEDRVGPARYAAFYLLSGAAALTAHVALQPGSSAPVIGASGAVAGVMGAYMVWFPRAPVTTLLLLFVRDVRAWLLLSIWFVAQFFTAPDSQVAWAAHVGGFVFGVLIAGAVRLVPGGRRLVWRAPYDRAARERWDSTGAGTLPPPPRG